jgi:hypothetical protein
MTGRDESGKEIFIPTKPLLKPEHLVTVEAWSLRPLHDTGKSAQVVRELRREYQYLMK